MAPGPARRSAVAPAVARRPAVALAILALSGCAHAPPPTREAAARPSPFRRVVTGLDASGRSAVVEDGPVAETARVSAATAPADALALAPYLRHILEMDPIWLGVLPVDAASRADPVRGSLPSPDDGLAPNLPRAGFIAVIQRWSPGGPAFPLHDSPTLDLGVVVSGAVELQLEAGSTVLRAGDVFVQRGTRHTWKVVGDEPCVMFGILLDATGRAGGVPVKR